MGCRDFYPIIFFISFSHTHSMLLTLRERERERECVYGCVQYKQNISVGCGEKKNISVRY